MRLHVFNVRSLQPNAQAAMAMVLALSVASFGVQAEDQTPTGKPSAEPETCTLEPGPVKTVARVLDAETVQLDDGSEVRLTGALAPRARDAGAVPGSWPAEQDAIAALTELVLGRSVKLAYGGGQHRDRYGRHVAHLFVDKDGENQWVAGQMLAQGHARAYGLPQYFGCARELLANERLAREDRRGIWAIALYRPKPAAMTGALMALRSTFQIVEGQVASVSRTKSAAYLNFGTDWKTDFTIRIGKSVLSSDAAWAASLDGLGGQTVSVRGWIERRNGPLIDLADPSQLELKGLGPPAVSRAPESAPDIPRGAGPEPAPEITSVPDANTPAPEPRKDSMPAKSRRHKEKHPEPKAPGAINL